MDDTPDAVFSTLVGKLDRLSALADADRDATRSLPAKIGTASANHYLVREGRRVENCCLLLSGYACRHKMTSEGGRQIVSFHIPGDLLDIQHLLLDRADHNVQAITEVRIAWIPIGAIRDAIAAHPAIGEALWKDSLIEASIFREWVLNVGRRDARARIAHLLCEFALRREAAGLGGPEQFDLPMSQEQIGDATGLTSVHVNRTLQVLGLEGLIERDRRQVSILDWERLRAVADFDPAYLHAA